MDILSTGCLCHNSVVPWLCLASMVTWILCVLTPKKRVGEGRM
jgi:hypothetical protein